MPTTTSVASVGNYSYVACYVEGTSGRALTGLQINAPTAGMTNEYCIQQCNMSGFTVAGTEYSYQCFCGNDLQNGAVISPNQADCNMPCSGNGSEICGAGDRLTIYSSLSTIPVYQPPSIKTTGLPGSWTWVGCFANNVNNTDATLYAWISNTNQSVETCLNLCHSYGYQSAALQYDTYCRKLCTSYDHLLPYELNFELLYQCRLPGSTQLLRPGSRNGLFFRL